MNVIRINKKMSDKLGGVELEGRTFSVELMNLISPGFCECGGCFFLRYFTETTTSVTESDFMDKTGFECFVNSIHIDDYVPADYLVTACMLVNFAFQKWRELGRELVMQAIISNDEFGANVKFHLLRDGEAWIGGSLDKYEDPIMVWDSMSVIAEVGELKASK